jgi:HD-GYP domain-containing protein (c-di-GMP phosphodiesterase class II)
MTFSASLSQPVNGVAESSPVYPVALVDSRDELEAIVPRIAAMLTSAMNANYCAMFVYHELTESTVARCCRACAEMMGLPPEDVEHIDFTGLLHDIGKLSIPDRILSKADKLTADERTLIMMHPALLSLVPLVRHHHERFDGDGYPGHLAGDDVPIGASIIPVADAFDTMTSERTDQPRRTLEQAFSELRRYSATQFHPLVAETLIAAIERDPDITAAAQGSTTRVVTRRDGSPGSGGSSRPD